MKLSISQRNPFTVIYLPLVGRLHRSSFRSGSANGSSMSRLLSRLFFYPLRALSFREAPGKLQVKVGEEERSARFDARNRQFSALYFDIFSSGYEPEFTTIIDALVPDDGVLYDIGSNWGFFAIHLASRSKFRGRVHAFEPWPSTHVDLSRLVKDLDLGSRISCHPIALSNSSGHASMQSPGHSGLAHISEDDQGTRIQTATLDDLDFEPPTLIKIDAEGAEEKILQGGRRFLAEHHPMILFENRPARFGDDACLAVLVMLEELGYHLFAPNLLSNADGQCQVELIKVTAETRDDHAEFLNLFACHSSDLGRMEAVTGK
jgi:FkbM family methyltransferase